MDGRGESGDGFARVFNAKIDRWKCMRFVHVCFFSQFQPNEFLFVCVCVAAHVVCF